MLLWAGRKTSKASINFFVLHFDFQVHFFIEPFCISLKRTLPPAHPLNQMLKYHCREVIVPNTFGTPSLVDEFRFMDLLFAFGNDGANRLLRDAHEFSTWEVTDFRRNIKVKVPTTYTYSHFEKLQNSPFLSVRRSVCLAVYLSVCLSPCLCSYLSDCLCLSISQSVCLFVWIFVYLFIWLFVWPTAALLVCLSHVYRYALLSLPCLKWLMNFVYSHHLQETRTCKPKPPALLSLSWWWYENPNSHRTDGGTLRRLVSEIIKFMLKHYIK